MSTKRTPINRPPRGNRVTPAALAAFREMQKLEARCICEPISAEQCKACERWWEQHSVLVAELRLKPWEWPAVENPDAESPYPEGSEARTHDKPDLAAQERYRLLERAAAEAAKQQKAVS